MSVAGRCYLERGHPVTVLVGWGPGGGVPAVTARVFAVPPARFGPRNVLIERPDGTCTVRGFRGLRSIRPATKEIRHA